MISSIVAINLERYLSDTDLPVTDQTVAIFSDYLSLLQEFNQRAGFTSLIDDDEIVKRHFIESIALLVSLHATGVISDWEILNTVDIGPGGGFPSVPMAIMDSRLQLSLVESNGKRAHYLEQIISDLQSHGILTNTRILNARAEDAGRLDFFRECHDLVVSRAVAPLNVLVEYSLPMLRDGGIFASVKGSRVHEEIADAKNALGELGGQLVTVSDLPLIITPHQQSVVIIEKKGPIDEKYPRRAGVPARRPL